MKIQLSILGMVLFHLTSFSQIVESTSSINYKPLSLSQYAEMPISSASHSTFKKSDEWWQIISRENVLYKSHNLQLLFIEKEIIGLESAECTALKKRDTLTLIRLWGRDFTMDKKVMGVVTDKVGLPYYPTLVRMIETLTIIGENAICTSGYEMFCEVGLSGYQPLTKRPYFHTWTHANGLWKLTTKAN